MHFELIAVQWKVHKYLRAVFLSTQIAQRHCSIVAWMTWLWYRLCRQCVSKIFHSTSLCDAIQYTAFEKVIAPTRLELRKENDNNKSKKKYFSQNESISDNIKNIVPIYIRKQNCSSHVWAVKKIEICFHGTFRNWIAKMVWY